jgi:hypothetical protein
MDRQARRNAHDARRVHNLMTGSEALPPDGGNLEVAENLLSRRASLCAPAFLQFWPPLTKWGS